MKFTALDPNGVPRCWAEHDNADVAETMCREEVFFYLRGRRDLRPAAKWIFKKEIDNGKR